MHARSKGKVVAGQHQSACCGRMHTMWDYGCSKGLGQIQCMACMHIVQLMQPQALPFAHVVTYFEGH